MTHRELAAQIYANLVTLQGDHPWLEDPVAKAVRLADVFEEGYRALRPQQPVTTKPAFSPAGKAVQAIREARNK